MLILTRRAGENVVVGDDIVISVIEVRGDAVRIGIQAPRSLAVHREEVWLELQKANSEAASPSDDAIGATLERLRARADRPNDPPRG
ncbi:carbon storage regulator, CsrA [Jatrophihabitans endophyticus]|uniref:Translational regulator CsrA n=1 Tax=Jatrophihabitans endophyticus TaxID=1206085 RepID=A0A1M5IDR4_9ACTN|nr:carbon storage regulator CsrA [Jatrophihabitans endophyticus]SHG26422.1 carbon storage regulator, CsrA [Jatrophihabitans endophyticus]